MKSPGSKDIIDRHGRIMGQSERRHQASSQQSQIQGYKRESLVLDVIHRLGLIANKKTKIREIKRR